MIRWSRQLLRGVCFTLAGRIRWLLRSVCHGGIILLIWDSPRGGDEESWQRMQSGVSVSVCVHTVCVLNVCGWNIMATSPCWLFDECISPAVMTVAAAGCVSVDYVCLSSVVRVIHQHPLPPRRSLPRVAPTEHAGARTRQHAHLHVRTFSCECGVKHLSAVTAELDVDVSRGGGWGCGQWGNRSK